MKKWLLTALFVLALSFSCKGKDSSLSKTQTYANIRDSLIYKDSVTKVFSMTCDPYNVNVIVIITANIYDAAAFVRYRYQDMSITYEDFLFRSGITFSNPGHPIILWLPFIPRSEEEINIANHELTHVVGIVMLGAGIPFTRDTQEPYAYEMGYLSQQFYHGAWN